MFNRQQYNELATAKLRPQWVISWKYHSGKVQKKIQIL